MLVLSRRRGQAILLDGGIRIVVLESDRRTVRLGIEAPATTGIQREELVSQVAAENIRAGARGDRSEWLAALPLREAVGPVIAPQPAVPTGRR
jgi:carbon storage regulator